MAAETMTIDDMRDEPGVTRSTRAEWREIERRARAEAEAELAAIETTPLEYGAHIAWTERGYGGTMDGLSAVHRVEVTDAGKEATFCGETIPAPILRLSLTPGWIRTQPLCRWCAQKFAAALHHEGAA